MVKKLLQSGKTGGQPAIKAGNQSRVNQKRRHRHPPLRHLQDQKAIDQQIFQKGKPLPEQPRRHVGRPPLSPQPGKAVNGLLKCSQQPAVHPVETDILSIDRIHRYLAQIGQSRPVGVVLLFQPGLPLFCQQGGACRQNGRKKDQHKQRQTAASDDKSIKQESSQVGHKPHQLPHICFKSMTIPPEHRFQRSRHLLLPLIALQKGRVRFQTVPVKRNIHSHPELKDHACSMLCQISGKQADRLLQRHISAHGEKNLPGASSPGERRHDHAGQCRRQKGVQNPENRLPYTDQNPFCSHLAAKQL